jgi:hypothetical protein
VDADALAVLEPVVDAPAFGIVSGTATDTNGRSRGDLWGQ